MTVFNLDINPTEKTIAQFPLVRCLVENKAIQDAFRLYEEKAAFHKRHYHLVGKAAVVATALSAAFSVAFASFRPSFVDYEWLTIPFAAIALLALAAHAWVFIAGYKEEWLAARYGAERLRSIKFQAFSLAGASHSSADLCKAVERYCDSKINALETELNNASSASLENFIPEEALNLQAEPERPANRALYEEARTAYRMMRLSHQIDFAAGQIGGLGRKRGIWRSATDFLFILGGLLVVVSLVDRALNNPLGHVVDWVEFATVVVFVASAALAILDNASISEQSDRRYRAYATSLRSVRSACIQTDIPLNEEIHRTELLALGELQQFCDQAGLITYRL